MFPQQPPSPPLNISNKPAITVIYNETHVKINNCQTLSDGINFIYTQQFKDEFSQQKKVNAIILMIEGKIDEIIWLGDQEFSSKDWLLVAYKTTQQMIIYWRDQGTKTFLKLHFDESYLKELKNFVLEFLIDNLSENKLASSQFLESDIGLMTLCDTRGYNLLMHAVEAENEKLFGELLKFPFDLNEKSKAEEFLSDIAWKKKNQKLLLKILNVNVPYPKDFDENQASKEIKEFVKISKELHENIRNIEKVKETVEKFSHLRYFYATQNVSVAATAIKLKLKKVYILLLDNDCNLSPIEDSEEIFDFLDNGPSDSKILRICDMSDIHDVHSKDFGDKYLNFHFLNSIVGCDEYNEKKYRKCMRKAYEKVNLSEDGKLILQLTANCKNLKTHFDFNRDSVNFLYPYNTNSGTDGLFNFITTHIYVGAKKMRIESSEQDKFDAAAIVKHEHCHLALNMTFLNDCKPYSKYDRKNRKNFKKLVKKCKLLKDFENIISWVYDCYPKGAWHAELGVRVPQIRTFYHNNSVKLEELEKIYEELFKYFDDFVMPAMRETLKMFEKLSKDSNEISFDDLTKTYQDFVKDSEVEFQGQKVKLKEIFEAKDLTSEEIRKVLSKETLTVGKEIENNESEIYIERNFIDSDLKLFFWYSHDQKFDIVKGTQRNFEEIINEVQVSKVFLLSDHAGAGKTTTMRNLAQKIKNKMPRNWVEFVDLKRHIKIYEKYENISNVTIETVLKILMEILSITSDFESKVFQNLFKNGQVILLLDGVDEIAPKYKELFFEIIKVIKDLTENQQWIATRPQYTTELENILKNEAYKLLPLNKKNAKEMIEKCLSIKNIKIDQKQIELVLKQISNRKNKKVCYDQINPLMIKMVADLYIGGNFKKFNSKFELYEAFMQLKKDILAEKGPVPNRDRDIESKINVWEIHQIYAFSLLFEKSKFEDYFSKGFLESESYYEYDKEFVNFDDFQIFKKWKKEKSKWTPAAISQYSFLSVLSWNKEMYWEFPDFSHRTFAEFFAAKFIIETIKEALEDDDDLTEKEFKMRIKFAVWFLREGCQEFYKIGRNNIEDFLHDYLNSQSQEIKIGEHFLNFIESDEGQKIILRMSVDKYCFRLFSSLFSKLIKKSNYNERLFNALMVIKNGQSIWLKNILKYKTSHYPFYIIDLFELFLNSPFSNRAQFLGLEQSFNYEDFNIKINKETENIMEKDILFLFHENDVREEFYIWETPVNVTANLTKICQFLNFIIKVESFPFEIFKKFFEIYSYYFSSLIMRSEKLIDLYFEAINKHFHEKKNKINVAILQLFRKIQRDFRYIQVTQKYSENLVYFFEKLEKFLNFDCQIIQGLILNQGILYVSFTKDEKLQEFFAKYFDGNQILAKLESLYDYSWLLENIETKEEMGSVDYYCFSFCKCSIFKLFINHSENLRLINEVIDKYKEIYGANWFAHTDYTLKNNSNHLDVNDDIKKIENYNGYDFKISYIYDLLCLIGQTENSVINFEIFFTNHLSEILNYIINGHKILIEKTFETLEIFKVSEHFDKILTNGILNMRTTDYQNFLYKGIKKTKDSLENLKYFQEKLAIFLDRDSNKLLEYHKNLIVL